MTELSVEKLTELDAFNAERIAGGPALASVLDFHTWAYERYKLLEEGIDSWIGDDAS